MLDFFQSPLDSLDPAVSNLIEYEAERQGRKLILIPSESQAPEAVREALGSVFQNIYAEGYPSPSIHGSPQGKILDYELQLAHYRRYSDLRYYKGVEYVNVLEALARRRAAEAFATEAVPPEEIWANVQPLSGSPANSAIYAALVPLGSTVMGMDLLHGGHLTHGSRANRSGKLYNIVSYGINLETERLDYEAIEALAHQSKADGNPVRMIIAGYTSYPWMPDWARFRQIADSVGAYLLADISHIAGMVAAGGLAAALSTADGLLLTIANALSHDLYYKMLDPNATTARRVTISKVLLLVVALAAAAVASQKPADILFLVSAAFSFAAAAFFPALVLGIFWKRANKWGATLGMIAGLGTTFYYMATTQPWMRGIFGVTSPIELWWGISPISAGLFGVPLGFAVIIIVSLLTPAPGREVQELVEHVRYPNLRLAKA